MSHKEMYGNRPSSYSGWHRPGSISRFISGPQARSLSMVDIDAQFWLECRGSNREPLFVLETAIDKGHDSKLISALRNYARRCIPRLEAYLVFYTLSSNMIPDIDFETQDIRSFRVRQVFPEVRPIEHGGKFVIMTPKEYAEFLVATRKRCELRYDNFESSGAFERSRNNLNNEIEPSFIGSDYLGVRNLP